jgi:hypothetical protein
VSHGSAVAADVEALVDGLGDFGSAGEVPGEV